VCVLVVGLFGWLGGGGRGEGGVGMGWVVWWVVEGGVRVEWEWVVAGLKKGLVVYLVVLEGLSFMLWRQRWGSNPRTHSSRCRYWMDG
jgi:hypothetical protein